MINQLECAEWLKELRSGKYAKGVGNLCVKFPSGEKFCCLGVYCETRTIRKFLENGPVIYIYDNKHESTTVLPLGLASKLNINCQGNFTLKGEKIIRRLIQKDDNVGSLVSLNDYYCVDDTDFTRMADLIEALARHEAETGEECFETK